MRTVIAGTGSFIPEYRVSNDRLSEQVDTNDEWVTSRTGIRARHITAKGAEDMGIRASARALEDAGVAASELDWILAGSSSANHVFPGVACHVQAALGADRAACVDLSAACTGFLYGLQTADAYIRSGMAEKILVIGSDAISHITDWTDRNTCILFGDGAGAVVVTASDEPGILCSVSGSDGSRGDVLTCGSGRYAADIPFLPDREDLPRIDPYVRMDGRGVFEFAVRTVPQVVEQVLDAAQISKEEISLFLLHQANARILEGIIKKLGIPPEKAPVNLDETGNISAASVPVLLDEVNRAGRIRPGDKVVLAGFGGGLTWSAMVVEWR